MATRTRRGSGGVHDRGSLYVLWTAITASIWVASWFAMTHAFAHIDGGRALRAVSLTILAAGLTIRWVAILSLGRAFSVNVAIHAGQQLYRSGLFAKVRHPSYSGIMLCLVAVGLRLQNWVSLAVVALLPLLALLYRMHVEEQALAQAFGTAYESYRSSTKRLVPGVY